ncbi:hypothetical protein PUR34_14205 [Streptomyces sp. JV185]|uniref:hypothetical protein n=1 Tax=Streptomyces sp. JV185 TaxID=858638 RepID=UPI002E7A0182|nr:hypothetical protein [Streptomyces sp. JV185]MEE1769272.1 hypothetical protein [Streptomyces sp. JV185]
MPGTGAWQTLVALAAVMPQIAADEAIEVFDLVMGDLIRSSSTKMAKQRLRTLKGLDAAAILLREMWIAVSGTAAEAGLFSARSSAKKTRTGSTTTPSWSSNWYGAH